MELNYALFIIYGHTGLHPGPGVRLPRVRGEGRLLGARRRLGGIARLIGWRGVATRGRAIGGAASTCVCDTCIFLIMMWLCRSIPSFFLPIRRTWCACLPTLLDRTNGASMFLGRNS